jgi:hypothetical protein
MAVRRGRGQHEPIAPVIPLRPATTPEARENQLIADAVDLAQRQLRDGTASAQVITHFLKLGSTREQLEQERLRNENLLLQKKGEAMESAKRIEELYGQALSAMRTYQGQPDLALEGLTDEDL